MTSVGDFDFDGNADNLQYNLERRTDSVFAEGRWRVVPELSLQIGVRYDSIQDYGLRPRRTLVPCGTCPTAAPR